jgi:hypothetical protein
MRNDLADHGSDAVVTHRPNRVHDSMLTVVVGIALGPNLVLSSTALCGILPAAGEVFPL